MDLGYQKSKKISTLDLPWVICDPPLLFEFNNATSIEFGIRLTHFVKTDDWQPDALIDLATELLLSVRTEAGEEFELGTKESIISLIENSHIEFVRDCVVGWFYNVGVERLALKKKLAKSNEQ